MLTPAPTLDQPSPHAAVNHRPCQTAVGVAVLAVAGLMVWGALNIPADAGYAGVGPNFLPWVVAVALAICGVQLIWQARMTGYQHMPEPSGAAHGDWPALAWVVAGVLANASLINTLGFIFSCSLCFELAVRGAMTDLLIGLAIAAPVFWLFTKVLAVNLPALTTTGWL